MHVTDAVLSVATSGNGQSVRGYCSAHTRIKQTLARFVDYYYSLSVIASTDISMRDWFLLESYDNLHTAWDDIGGSIQQAYRIH